ncbi:MAG: type II 3-dehydroquinate dehydratase [Rhodothermia bacterium]|nr:type II 3-dehydroquinate dehydratase [Rhodothermia bacterium]
MKIAVINGPNLNLLGRREPGVYGSASLDELSKALRDEFADVAFSFFQSNVEGELIDELQRADRDGAAGIVFNPGGYTHTSVALRDAVAAISVPVIEVHISNVAAREPFRHVSMIAPECAGQIAGFGVDGYALAVTALLRRVSR